MPAMRSLQPPDTHHLRAAVGWTELGLRDEALRELDQISETQREHPDVLEVRWMISADAKAWDEALVWGQELVRLAPKRASGWLHRAYALRRASIGGLDKAWEALRPAADLFPKEFIIAYNLSCYACQLQRLSEARRWLHQAFKLGRPKHVKAMALGDEDLKPLWDEVRAL